MVVSQQKEGDGQKVNSREDAILEGRKTHGRRVRIAEVSAKRISGVKSRWSIWSGEADRRIRFHLRDKIEKVDESENDDFPRD